VWLTGAALVALRATRKPLHLESIPFRRLRPTKGGDREVMFDDTDFAGAEAGSIRGNCSKRILPLRPSLRPFCFCGISTEHPASETNAQPGLADPGSRRLRSHGWIPC
jgi:hypothetical protein